MKNIQSKIGMKQNPEYQYIYQYNPKIGLFCSTFRSIFAISVHEVHISTYQFVATLWLVKNLRKNSPRRPNSMVVGRVTGNKNKHF